MMQSPLPPGRPIRPGSGGRRCPWAWCLLLLLVAVACAPAGVREQARRAAALSAAGRDAEALQILKDLCRRSRGRGRSCTDLARVRGRLAQARLGPVRTRLAEFREAGRPVPLSVLDELAARVAGLEAVDPDAPGLGEVKGAIEAARGATSSAVNATLAKAEDLSAGGDWEGALKALEGAKALDPGTVGPRSRELADRAVAALAAEADAAAGREDWKTARRCLDRWLAIRPGDPGAEGLRRKIEAGDNAEAYLERAAAARAAYAYDEAVAALRRAAAYPDAPADVAERLSALLAEAAAFHFRNGASFLEQEHLVEAVEAFEQGSGFLAALPDARRGQVAVPKKAVRALADRLFSKAQAAARKGFPGAALLGYDLVLELEPGYPQAAQLRRAAEAAVAARARKCLAVTAFKGPAAAPEVGGIFTAELLRRLHRDLDADLRVVERASLDLLLKEYELARTAGRDTRRQDPSAGFRFTSADYLLLGEVVDYRVETSRQETARTIRVQTGTESVPNPAYVPGKTRDPKVPPVIRRPTYEDVRYRQTHYRKVGTASVSYRVVDARSGDVLRSEVLEASRTAEDDAHEGVEIGAFKLPVKLADLPPDMELLREAQEEVVEKLARQVAGGFRGADARYLAEAAARDEAGDRRAALERYADARAIMARKGRDPAAVTAKIREHLDVLAGF
ncbi:hypothetical protein G3N55_03525 [Dissulfurirhabdus thermomarina]|uniref:Tetratricopeptide repeat protein n=1 Tax=Dissulfurirhabdus thermomarina TaxID=1765737 RepID=A0A6N9TLK2_DISTH|nr:CsgG/HfaB family protein [Dissulfurirhabdus thermomarina]NDY41918.1 hypothetical protein [Dissulfurirhabdus thermomarina]NMX23925.1 hypothetical protein [Dissulfurirhabdus thermomarina]